MSRHRLKELTANNSTAVKKWIAMVAEMPYPRPHGRGIRVEYFILPDVFVRVASGHMSGRTTRQHFLDNNTGLHQHTHQAQQTQCTANASLNQHRHSTDGSAVWCILHAWRQSSLFMAACDENTCKANV